MIQKAVVWGFHDETLIQVIQDLENLRYIKIVKWFVHHEMFNFNLKKFTCNPHSALNENLLLMPAEIDNFLQKYFNLFEECYSRIPISRGKTNQELRHIFYIYAKYFYTMLYKNVDIVIFQNLPHVGVDIILYAIAKYLNIRTILTYQSHYENRFWYLEKIEDFGIFREIEPSEQLLLNIPKNFNKELCYMKNIKIYKSNCRSNLLKDLVRIKTKKTYNPITLPGVLQKYKECRDYIFLKNKILTQNVDLSRKYVYFGLHLQPELSTSLLGNKYVDQLLAIEHLSEIIPNDWIIYVKENPKQTFKQRGEFFYYRLKQIKNVYYISEKHNTHTLINNSQFVATITGTLGWEAISGGKNVLIFGQAWYKTFPGVFSYNENLSLDEIVSYKINHKELETKYSLLMSKTFKGIINFSHIKSFSNYCDKKNIEYIKFFLIQVLKNQK